MTDLVFFGAGASEPFGIPTMEKMVKEFEEQIEEDKELLPFYCEIKRKLIEGYKDSTDIESILSVLEGIIANKKPVELGHFIFYYIFDNRPSEQFPSDEVKLAKKLRNKIHDYIKEVCNISNNDQEKIIETYKQTYLPLFKHISEEKKDYDGVALARKWKAYTTNYDDIFEDFWREFELPRDHFKRHKDSENYYFSVETLEEDSTFCKLHGSLDWTKEVGKNRIVRKTDSKFKLLKTADDVMLFPIQRKDVYAHPWFTLFHDLKLGLSNKSKLYAIGYAFNDEFIKNAFQEALESDPDKKLIIINPVAEQIKGEFPESIRKQIELLPIKFGGKFFKLQFEDHVKRVKTIDVRFDMKNDQKNMSRSTLEFMRNQPK